MIKKSIHKNGVNYYSPVEHQLQFRDVETGIFSKIYAKMFKREANCCTCSSIFEHNHTLKTVVSVRNVTEWNRHLGATVNTKNNTELLHA